MPNPNRKRRGRGEGSIYQRADGCWCCCVSGGYDDKGKRRRRIIYGKSKKEVQDKLREAQHRNLSFDMQTITVGEFLAQWIESRKKQVAPTTWHREEQMVRLKITPRLGRIRLSQLGPMHVARYYQQMDADGESADAQHRSGVTLGRAMRDAVRLKLIGHNPVSEISKPRVERPEMKFLNQEQVKALYKAASGDRLSAIYVLAVATGMRMGELFALQWNDVDFEGKSVGVQRTLEEHQGKCRLKEPKSAKSRRHIVLPAFTVKALLEHRKRMLAEGNIDAPVFCSEEGKFLRRSNFTRRNFHPLLKRANLPKIGFHSLRHTAASLLLLQGVHPKVVSERLGHSSIELTLNTYSHVLPSLQHDAADKLGVMFG